MRGDDALVARAQRHDRHRLGGVDREVPPRMVLNLAVPDAPKLLLADLPRKQRLERLAVDRSFESQIGGDLPTPFRRLVAALRIIVADRIVAGDVTRLSSEAARMDHAGLAGLRRPPGRPC